VVPVPGRFGSLGETASPADDASRAGGVASVVSLSGDAGIAICAPQAAVVSARTSGAVRANDRAR
jgi:hypothetical protein